jgi:hypothetical protein
LGNETLNHLGSLHLSLLFLTQGGKEKLVLRISLRLGSWMGDLPTCDLANVEVNWNCFRKPKECRDMLRAKDGIKVKLQMTWKDIKQDGRGYKTECGRQTQAQMEIQF